MKKYIYKIGDYVIVDKTMERYEYGDKRVWRVNLPHLTTKPRLGQVVGITTKYDGILRAYINDPAYLSTFKSHRFWLVRFGLSNKPVCVSEECMRLASAGEIHDLPYRYPPNKMSERERKNLSEDSVNWPRDKRGRWVAGPMVH